MFAKFSSERMFVILVYVKTFSCRSILWTWLVLDFVRPMEHGSKFQLRFNCSWPRLNKFKHFSFATMFTNWWLLTIWQLIDTWNQWPKNYQRMTISDLHTMYTLVITVAMAARNDGGANSIEFTANILTSGNATITVLCILTIFRLIVDGMNHDFAAALLQQLLQARDFFVTCRYLEDTMITVWPPEQFLGQLPGTTVHVCINIWPGDTPIVVNWPWAFHNT